MEKIDFGSLRRLAPVSPEWGFDRGKPIDRHYIETFLAAHSEVICGDVLEIKDRKYTSQFGGDRVVKSEVLDISSENREATLIADLTKREQFSPEQFDCIIFTQTLQFINAPASALKTLYKILKPSGSLLITCPGITRIEQAGRDGGWYWAFTPLSLGMLLEETFGSGVGDIDSHGNVFTATGFLWGISAEEMSVSELDYKDSNYPVILTAIVTKNS